MHLDLARELKAFCLKECVESLASRAAPFPGLALGAKKVKSVDPIQRTLALGITRKSAKNFQLAVRLQSRALEGSPQIESILKKAKGEANVRYIGRVVKRAAAPWNQRSQRPLLIGISIGHFRITAGTLGCFVQTRTGGLTRILSNNHVLADENAGRKGDNIIQPGFYDGGNPEKDSIGELDRFVSLKKNGINFVDAAIASVDGAIEFNSKALRGIGLLKGLANSLLDAGERVAKLGRTTGLSRGRATAIELDNVVVGYDRGNLRFDNQIEIEGEADKPFSQGGDSGALIVNSEQQGIALLFAGGDQGGSNDKGLTFAHPIASVLDALAVDLLY